MIGPPGTGKSMLARRLPGILPPMSEDEALASATIASLAGRFSPCAWGMRPYRAPHHTASAVALVGGGSSPSVDYQRTVQTAFREVHDAQRTLLLPRACCSSPRERRRSPSWMRAPPLKRCGGFNAVAVLDEK